MSNVIFNISFPVYGDILSKLLQKFQVNYKLYLEHMMFKYLFSSKHTVEHFLHNICEYQVFELQKVKFKILFPKS